MSESPTAPRRPLVAARGPAALVVLIAAGCFAAMAAWVHDTRVPKAVDVSVLRWLLHHSSSFVQQTSLGVTDPVLTVGTCVAVAVIALVIKRWDVAALAVIGPVSGLFLESHVLKPAVHRLFSVAGHLGNAGDEGAYAFPSGHETGVTSVTVLLALLTMRTLWSRRVKALVLTVLALWTAVGALALVRSFYHYFTDTVGGVLLAVVVMLSTALVIDLVASRLSSPAGRDRSRTVPAA